MKKEILIFLIILPFYSASSQDFKFPIDSTSGEIVYSGIVDSTNSTK